MSPFTLLKWGNGAVLRRCIVCGAARGFPERLRRRALEDEPEQPRQEEPLHQRQRQKDEQRRQIQPA